MDVHRFSFFSRTAKSLLIALAGVIAGCGEEAPPYESLPLRDALRAAPEVVVTLSDESRRELAFRLQDAEYVEPETIVFAPKSLELETLVISADAVREASNKGAMMFGEIVATEGHGLFEIRAKAEAEIDDSKLLDLRGKASDVAAPFEEAALRGAAGKTLSAFVEQTHAKSVVRMTGLPVAAVAWNDQVYVNESWLVAMSALENECVVPIMPNKGETATSNPGSNPLSVDFGPYSLPDNLLACVEEVNKTCSCAQNSSCSHPPTDSTFPDSNTECAWANNQSANASALCIMALMKLDYLAECVALGVPSCTLLPINDRDDAVSFATNEQCVANLNRCLTDGTSNPSNPNPSNASSCGDSCDDCRYSDNKGDDCQQCSDDTQLCLETCELCVTILEVCATSAERPETKDSPFKYASIKPVSQCSVRPASPKSPIPAPIGTTLWLVAPVVYLFSRSRRRR
jgi:hypothetical protein